MEKGGLYLIRIRPPSRNLFLKLDPDRVRDGKVTIQAAR
jgi:hypothetical protein